VVVEAGVVVVVVVVGVVVVDVDCAVVVVVDVDCAVVVVVDCSIVVEVGDRPAVVCGTGDDTGRVALEPESAIRRAPAIGVVAVVAAPVLVAIPLVERDSVAPLGGGAAAAVVAPLGVVDPPGRAGSVGMGIRAVAVSRSSPTRVPTATAIPARSRTRAMPAPTTVTTRREPGVSS
jgi:hypothetical protein